MADDLQKIPAIPPALEETPEYSYVEPDLSQDLDALKYREKLSDVEKQEHELVVERAMLSERKKYARYLFWLISIWLVFICVVIVLAAVQISPQVVIKEIHLSIRHYPFKLSDSVLIALISTTTVNVLGLFYIVARWLFPNRYSGTDDKKIGAEKAKT